MDATANRKGQEKESWVDFLSGNRLAIITLISIGVVTLIGTLIPQRGPGLDEEQYELLLNSSGLMGVLGKIGFLDIFHSFWFYALILLLAVNLSLCTTVNFGRVYRAGTSRGLDLGEKFLSLMGRRQEFKSRGVDESTVARVIKPVRQAQLAEGTYFYGESGDIHRYGAIITHISILTLAAGAVIGAIFGTDGQMLIPESEKNSVVQLRHGGEFELPFAVQCDKFTVEFYEGSRQPKKFQSDLTFLAAQGAPYKTSIEVNRPAEFGGYRFFQSTYGQLPPTVMMKATRRSNGQAVGPQAVRADTPVALPDGGGFVVKDLEMNYVNAGVDYGFAALIQEIRSGKPQQPFWVIFSNPKFDEIRGGDYVYQITDLSKAGYYTGLMVTKNPGVNVVWAGSALGAIGLIIALYIPYRRTLVRIKDGVVTVGYSDSRGADVTASKIAEIVDRLKAKNENSQQT